MVHTLRDRPGRRRAHLTGLIALVLAVAASRPLPAQAAPSAPRGTAAAAVAPASPGADSAAALETVRRYIDALMQRDTGAIRALSVPGATTLALREPEDRAAAPRARGVDEVIDGLARETRRFVGRVWDVRVRVEGPIAHFVAPYDAWYDGRFSHCGEDHYILARVAGRWRVSQLVFTRRAAGCAPGAPPPPGD